MTDNPEIGKIQILLEFVTHPDDAPPYYEWGEFNLPICFSHIVKRRKLPKARVWNGSEWVRCGIRDHVQGILELIDEDLGGL